MKRYAVISVGTNSCRFLIAARIDDAWRVEYHESRGTRLGEGVDASRRLDEGAMARTLDAARDYAKLSAGVDRLSAIGTSALRDAANTQEFLDRFREATGVALVILSGDEEARCSF
ncbi:MAG TPA: hypothetical protein VEJ20_04590, partial [Candidatus Eremiobacteraceae bacterium]|nr:hypothetical protein [Candidatus Eremiobacteraceae bacterium]